MFIPASVSATINPIFELQEGEKGQAAEYLAQLPKMEQVYHTAPLGQHSVVTIPQAVIDGVTVGGYEFLVVRRYYINGELHLGGSNGEVLNATKFIADFKAFLENDLAENGN